MINSIPANTPVQLTQGVVYALPPKSVFIASDQTVEVSQSVSGPWVTVIQGNLVSALFVRCPSGNVLLTAKSSISIRTSGPTSQSYSQKIASDGATNYWRLNDTVGPVVDSIGGANGTLITPAEMTLNQSGVTSDGKSILFAGSPANDKIQTTINVVTPVVVTVELWFKTVVAATNQLFSNVHGGAVDNPIEYGTANNKVEMQCVYTGSALNGLISINDGLWHHAVYVLDGTNGWIYVDGVLDVTGPFPSNTVATWLAAIGCNVRDRGHALIGSMAEVALYPRVLSGSEVSNHYNLSGYKKQGYVPLVISDSPTSYWRLNDVIGPTIANYAGLTATMSGGITLNQLGPLSRDSTSMLFDGTTGKIQPGASVNCTVPMSIECWIKLPGPDLNPHAIITNCEASAVSNSILFAVFNGCIALNVTSVGIVQGSVRVDNNVWHHVVVTTNSTTVKFYVDGVPDGGAQALTRIQTNRPGMIGWNPASPTVFWKGLLAELAMYQNVELTPAQVLNHYNARLI